MSRLGPADPGRRRRNMRAQYADPEQLTGSRCAARSRPRCNLASAARRSQGHFPSAANRKRKLSIPVKLYRPINRSVSTGDCALGGLVGQPVHRLTERHRYDSRLAGPRQVCHHRRCSGQQRTRCVDLTARARIRARIQRPSDRRPRRTARISLTGPASTSRAADRPNSTDKRPLKVNIHNDRLRHTKVAVPIARRHACRSSVMYRPPVGQNPMLNGVLASDESRPPTDRPAASTDFVIYTER